MRRRLAAVFLLALAAGACGIPLDDRPQIISAEELPGTLQPPEVATTTTSTTVSPRLSEDVLIYLVDPASGTSDLVPISRQVPVVVGGIEIERLALEQLLLGPTTEEQLEIDLTTFVVPSGDAPIEVFEIRRPTDDQVSVVLSEAPAIEGGERTTAFAQMVFTLTQFDDVERVQFLVRNEAGEDEFIAVKTDTDEGDVTRPVDRSDFSTLAPTQAPG
ncbi:MAG: GerMN domain-containing protein [Acidimicrobiales bacterium]